MLGVHDKQMDTDEYVYILPDYVGNENKTEIWVDYSSKPDGRDQDAKAAFEKAFVVSKIKMFLHVPDSQEL